MLQIQSGLIMLFCLDNPMKRKTSLKKMMSYVSWEILTKEK